MIRLRCAELSEIRKRTTLFHGNSVTILPDHMKKVIKILEKYRRRGER